MAGTPQDQSQFPVFRQDNSPLDTQRSARVYYQYATMCEWRAGAVVRCEAIALYRLWDG